VIAVVGEPGVGKSRLFHEFTHSHRLEGWLVLGCSSVSYGKTTACLPVIELLRGYFEVQSRDDYRKIREKVTGKLLTLDETLKPILPALLALLDVPMDDGPWKELDPPQRRRRTFDAVRQLLLREACEQPVLLLFEDLHWNDGETQVLLDSLVESLPAARIMLLVNYRPEYSHTWGSKTYYRQIRIDPLPPETADELLDSLLGTDAALRLLKQLLIERTEANPLFLEESVRALVETGALAGRRGAYRLTRPVEQLNIPATVQAILAARIDSLGTDAKRLLQAAAVIGKDVPMGLLFAIADMPEHEVRAELAHLQASEFLYEVGLFPDLEYTFKHALTHDIAYLGLLQNRRRELHARVVDAIERLYRDRLPSQIERLAHHSARGEVWEKALLYTRQAALRAAARSAHREGITFFEQALLALKNLPNSHEMSEEAIEIRLELRTSLFTVGDLPRVLEVLKEADAIAARIGDKRRQTMALTFLANHYFEMARLEQAGTFADRALKLASELGDPTLEAIARVHQGRILYSRGDYRAAINVLESAAGVLREHAIKPSFGSHAGGIHACLPFLARALVEVGEFKKAVELGKESLQVCTAHNDAFGLVHAHFVLGFAHLRQGDIDQALPKLETGLDLARTKSVSFLEPLMCAAVGSAYTQSGRIIDGLSLLEAGVHGADQMGHPGFLGWLQGWLAEGYLLAGRPADALATATSALDAARQAGRRGNEAHALRILGDIATNEMTDAREAVRYYTDALGLATELDMAPAVAHCHSRLGKSYRCRGDFPQAQQHLMNAASMYRTMGMASWQRSAEAEITELIPTHLV
jgi:tetratricopeptide (TPR) repeat protein